MRSLLQAGAVVQRRLEQRGWRFCFIGGVANFRWGTPRLTNDLDLTLLTGFGRESSFATALLAEYESRVPDGLGFALEHRVLLLRTADGFGLDIALGAMPFEERTIERSSVAEIVPGAPLRTCSATDLVVHKSFAGRPQDWVDVEGVILKQRGALDWPQLWADLTELAALKGEPELLTTLESIAHRTEAVIGAFSRPR